MELQITDRPVQRDRLPLGCDYRLILFKRQPISSIARGSLCVSALAWSVGALSDGETEVLGVWPHSSEGSLDWVAVFDELIGRGVERIRFVVGADGAVEQVAFPEVTVLGIGVPSSNGLSSLANRTSPGSKLLGKTDSVVGAPAELPPRALRLLRRCDEAAQRLERGLTPAIRRHGPFENPAAATAFVETWLLQAERRLHRQQLALQRRTYLRAAAPAC